VTVASVIRWLRISYWVGALVDCVAAVQMLSPRLFRFGMGLPGFEPGSDYRYAMGMGTSLMLGWIALLLWADRQPMERKGVLLLTVVPVIAGLAANEAWAVRVGFLAGRGMLPVWALQLGLSALFLGSYWRARKPQRAPGAPPGPTSAV
jgi:hypothetical protein